jgi:hypothetical protein
VCELPVLSVQLSHPSGGVGLNICVLEWNASRLKMTNCICPKSVIVVVQVNGQPCCALLDLSSLSNFMLTMLVDQLKVKLNLCDKLLPLQLVVFRSQNQVKVCMYYGTISVLKN